MDIPQTCCDANSDIHKTKLTVNMFITVGYVNNYGKNHCLQFLACSCTGVYCTTNKGGSGPGVGAADNFGIPTTMDLGGAAPLWLSQLFQNLESRLLHIDSQLSNQNSRWQNMACALQAQSVALQNQDTRMLHIERQMSEINGLKNNVRRMEVKMNALESNLLQ